MSTLRWWSWRGVVPTVRIQKLLRYEREALEAAVSYVDEKMHDISDRTKSNIAERIAVMAALNIAHEFLSSKAKGGEPVGGLDFGAVRRRISDMEAQLDVMLAPQEKLF